MSDAIVIMIGGIYFVIVATTLAVLARVGIAAVLWVHMFFKGIEL